MLVTCGLLSLAVEFALYVAGQLASTPRLVLGLARDQAR